MKKVNRAIVMCVLVLALSLSLLSAAPGAGKAQPLLQGDEAGVVGAGDKECMRAWGLGLALAAAALSPCSVLCAALAWYDLALIGAYC